MPDPAAPSSTIARSEARAGRAPGALAGLLAVLAALAGGACSDGPAPPAAGAEVVGPPLGVDVVQLDLVERFAAGDPAVRVLREDPDFPLAAHPFAFVDKEQRLASDADALVVHARAESAFEVTAGPFAPGARLRVATMVFSHFRNDPERADPAPVVFRVLVDGEERLALRSDYILDREGHEHPYDQLMRRHEIPLGGVPGRPVTLRFETTRARPEAGTGAATSGATTGAAATGARAALAPGVAPAEPLWWDLSVVQPVAVPRQAASPARPNLLVLMVDTLGARRTSLHGYGRPTTPALDDFARGGTVFDRALSTSSWTLPATASLLTGLPPNTHGVLGDTRSYLMDGLSTWPEQLRRAGLEGAAFVANPLVQRANGFHQGFGFWEQADDEPAGALNERLLRWLDGQPPRARWFAYVHYMDPHAPYGAPGEARERFTAGYSEARDFGGFLPNALQRGEIEPLGPEAREHVVDLYDGEVAWFDACFGRLREELAWRGLLESTVVLLTSDHGEELFEHGGLGHGYSLHDELLAVPLVIAGPGVPAGRRVAAPVSTASVAATLVALGGAPALPDAAPALLPLPGPGAAASEPVFASVRTQLFGPRRNLVAAQDAEGRKLILTLDDKGAPAAREAYDLRDDPLEAAPLDLAARADRGAWEALEAAALRWQRESAERRISEPLPADDALQREMDEAMRQVGYIGARGR